VNPDTNSTANNALNTIRCCPFCAATCHLTYAGINPLLYGVHCRSCGANIPATHPKSQDAISAWNRRSGLAAMGGRATRGIRSPRKLAAARRNLKVARQWKQIRQQLEIARTVIKPFEQKLLAKIAEDGANDRAWLKERESAILADPTLRGIYQMLQSRWASTSNDHEVA
jgi:hypothetical protein